MKRLQHFIVNDSEIFGPGTDLVISLAAVLLITLAFTASSYQRLHERERQGRLDLQRVQTNQMKLVDEIAKKYRTQPNWIDDNKYGISIRRSRQNDIVIENDATLQRISFGGHILFDKDDARLNAYGKLVLRQVGDAFKQKLDGIQEIQIQGHADIQKTLRFSSNLQLAAHRAIAVFEFLQHIGIDPTRHIMSATSFGEYKPVERIHSDKNYNPLRLARDNSTEEKRQLNRRIELVLIYRQER
jgi:flagellar motor protein MotB